MATEPGGREWLIDAAGCSADALGSVDVLRALFERIVKELGLRPVAPALWHVFSEGGGITGVLLLGESHLAAHTFPERGFAAFNLYCCRPRAAWPWRERLAETLGACDVEVRSVARG